MGNAFLGQHERHPVDHQRFDHARYEPLRQPVQVEVAVQIAGKADERAPVVVPVAIEGAIEGVLNRLLHGRRQQQRHQRDHDRQHPVVLRGALEEHALDALQQHGVNRDDRAEGGRVDQRALDDHLDVHQPVADDGRGERQRNEAQRERRELHGQRRLHAHRPRQRIAERKGRHAERRAPRNPAKLAACRDRSDFGQGTRERDQARDEAHREVEILGAIERCDHGEETRRVRRALHEGGHPRGAEQQRRKVNQRNDGTAGACPTSSGARARETRARSEGRAAAGGGSRSRRPNRRSSRGDRACR